MVELAFRALGSRCRIRLVLDEGTGPVEGERLLGLARHEIEALEQAWSRFRPSSELSALNAAHGSPTHVGPETFALVRAAVTAWQVTDGRFDPTVLPALEAAGYTASFDEGAVRHGTGDLPPRDEDAGPTPSPGCAGLVLDAPSTSITLPAGVRLDLGGIGKGRAADLVAHDLLALGAAGVCVDLGGDVRVAGRPPEGSGWAIAVAHPDRSDVDLAVVDLADGAVATSSRRRRRWTTDRGTEAHHLIDPSTGAPTTSDLVAVTVIAAEAAWAEVYAKAALVAGSADGIALLADAELAAIAVTTDGAVLRAGPLDRFERRSLPV